MKPHSVFKHGMSRRLTRVARRHASIVNESLVTHSTNTFFVRHVRADLSLQVRNGFFAERSSLQVWDEQRDALVTRFCERPYSSSNVCQYVDRGLFLAHRSLRSRSRLLSILPCLLCACGLVRAHVHASVFEIVGCSIKNTITPRFLSLTSTITCSSTASLFTISNAAFSRQVAQLRPLDPCSRRMCRLRVPSCRWQSHMQIGWLSCPKDTTTPTKKTQAPVFGVC